MQIFVQGTSTHAVNVQPDTTVQDIRKRICSIEQVAYEVGIFEVSLCSNLYSFYFGLSRVPYVLL